MPEKTSTLTVPVKSVIAAPKESSVQRHDPVPAAATQPAPAYASPKPKLVAKAQPVAAPAEEAKRKRGRPPGSKTAAKPAGVTPAVATPPVVNAAPAAAVVTPVARPIPTPTKPVVPTAAPTPNEGSKTMTDTMAKIQDGTKKFTGEAGAQAQAMFGDMSSRAKGAYEKGVKMTEEFSAFQKGNVEAMVESSKLAAKAAETMGHEAADFARKSFESTTAAMKTFASAKSPTELFKLQSDYLKSYFDSAVAESSKVTEAWLKLAGDVAQPLSNRVAVAVEKAKASATV